MYLQRLLWLLNNLLKKIQSLKFDFCNMYGNNYVYLYIIKL